MERMSIWPNPVTMQDIQPPRLQRKGDCVYTDRGHGAELARCLNVKETLYLPDEIGNEWIRELGTGALSNCEALTCVVLPRHLRSIGDYAFFQCGKLEEVRMNDGLRNIGERAFAQCTSLRTLYVPPTVLSISETAFEGVEDLTLTGAEDSFAYCYARAHGLFFMTAGGPNAA